MTNTGPLLSGYLADRSPTGHARGLLATRECVGGSWTYLPDDGGPRRTVHGPEDLYATPEEATLAARWRWRCKQGRPRYVSRPVAIGSV